jgi:hypothetical protein
MNWSKEVHDFGNVSLGIHYVDVEYLGSGDVNYITFTTGCGCTTPVFNKETKILKIGLNISKKGKKTTTVTINSKTKQEHIILKATGQ